MKKGILAMMMVFLLVPAVSPALQKGGVEIRSFAEVEVIRKDESGAKVVTRVDAAKSNVQPGDTVIFTITYLNNGNEPVTDVAVKNPIPQHMLYLDKSALGEGTRIDFSTDNGKSYGPIDKIRVRSADGKERPARAADITFVRWTLEKPLKKGGTGNVFFQAKLK
jgi:uncharacterized repeat protein (TIGR01451 family)